MPMRRAALLVVLLLAGCSSPDGDGDPLPTSTGTVTGSPTSSGTPTDNPVPYAPPAGWTEAEGHPDFPGLRLAGMATGSDRSFSLNATAANDGPQTYKVSAICVDPWFEGMRRGGGDVQHREPMAVCLAFGLAPFEPGETLDYNSSWNGTLWTDGSGGSGSSGGRYEPAPAGDYTWRIGFQAYRGGSSNDAEYEDATTIWLDLMVRVA